MKYVHLQIQNIILCITYYLEVEISHNQSAI